MKKRLEVIATSMDGKELPITQKPVISEDEPEDVIEHNGEVYEVPGKLIFYWAGLPEVLEARIQRAMDNGMHFMYPDGSYGCHYCGHYTSNITRLMMENPGKIIIHYESGTPGNNVPKCTYEGTLGIRWATRFTNEKTREVIMAEIMPCVVKDSIISELEEQGYFKGYESEREFNFPTISEVRENPELVKEFIVGRVESNSETEKLPKEGLIKRFYSSIRNFFR